MIFVNGYRLQHHSILINEDQFRGFLTCHTSLAKFELDGNTWVVRYMQNYPGHNLQLVSEFVGYRIAQILEAPVLEFNVVTIDKPFKKSGIEVLSGPATACKWVEDAYHLDVEKAPLDEFWGKEYYLKLVATIRTLDTWIMNFDRRKDGNMVFTGPKEAPKIWILDFDQSFLEKYRSPNCDRRLHWSEKEFSKEALDDSGVLSGFDGTGKVKSQSFQRWEHFEPVLTTMKNITEEELIEVLNEIPSEWGISKEAPKRWLQAFRYRRDITVSNIKREYCYGDCK